MSQELIKLGEQRARELGLKVVGFGLRDYYTADDIHKLLSKGIERFSFGGMCEWNAEPEMELRAGAKDEPLISGLIIGIRPIHKETREEKLEKSVFELVHHLERGTSESEPAILRAKQLLSERET